MSDQEKIQGLTVEQWEAFYRPGIVEFAASTWAYTDETTESVRLVFGNQGPYAADGRRTPIYTHAVTLSAGAAVDLAEALLKRFAAPSAQRPMTSAEG
jgi:hypothetical protein